MFDLMVICPKMTRYLWKGGHCSGDDKSGLILGGLGNRPRHDPFPLSVTGKPIGSNALEVVRIPDALLWAEQACRNS